MLVLPEVVDFVSWDALENLLNVRVTHKNVYLHFLNSLPTLVVLSSDSMRSLFRVSENLRVFDLISRTDLKSSSEEIRLRSCPKRLKRYFLFDEALDVCVGKNSEGYYELVKNGIIRYGKVKQYAFDDLLVVTVCKSRKCYVLIFDLLVGSYKEHAIRISNVENVLCSKNMCVVKGDGRCFSISLTSEEVHEVLCGLQPLIRCGSFDYFFDGALIVKSVKDTYEPIFPLNVENSSICCSEEDVVVSSKEGVCLLKDHLLLKLSNEVNVESIACFKNVVVFKVRGGSWFLVNVNARNVAYVEAFSCLPITEDLVLCVVKDGLVLLNTRSLITPEITVIKNYVSKEGYAQLEVKPWNNLFSVGFSSNVSVVKEEVIGTSKIIHLKPKELGNPVDVVTTLKTPVGTFSKVFQITSNPPILEEVIIKDCSYSLNGKLEDGVSNSKIMLSLNYSKTFPETPEVLITSLNPSMKITRADFINENDVLINAVLNVKKVSKDKPNLIKFKVSLKFFDGVIQDLGSFTMEFNKCREVREPATTLNIEKLQNNVLRISSKAGASLRVICGSKVLNGTLIDIKECEPPVIIDEYLTREGYTWVKTHVIKCLPEVNVVKSNVLSFGVRRSERNGVKCVDYVFTLPKESTLNFNLIDFMCSDELCTLKLSYKSNNPNVIVLACGSSFNYSYGDEGILEITTSLKELLSNGVYVFSIPIGFVENLRIYEVPVKDLVRFMLVKGFTLSRVLFNVVKSKA